MTALNSLLLVTHLSHLASPITKCSIYELPCLASLAQTYVTAIVSGSTSSGHETLDPLFLSPLHIEQDGLSLNWSEVSVLGLKQTVVEKVQFNKHDKSFRMKFRVPCLTLLTNYTSKGYVQKVPFFGEGKAVYDLYDLDNDLTIHYEIIKGEDGKEYFQLNKFHYWYDMRHADTFLENINMDEYTKVIQAQEYLKKEFSRAWQQFGRHFFDKFHDKMFETLKKFFLAQPVEDLLYDY